MSYYIRVFTNSNEPVTRQQLSAFILDGVYFDEDPLFEPSINAEILQDENWDQLIIWYEADKHPVVITRNIDDDLFSSEVQEVHEIIQRNFQGELRSSLIDRITACNQVIAFEVDPEGLSETAWEMLSALESALASSLNGFIYAPDDGFYDHTLKRIAPLS